MLEYWVKLNQEKQKLLEFQYSNNYLFLNWKETNSDNQSNQIKNMLFIKVEKKICLMEFKEIEKDCT